MSESGLYYARRSMTYGRPGSQKQLDRGQLVELQGLINDEKLVRLGYVAAAPKRATVVQCGICGAEFVTDEGLASHGRERHTARPPLSPREEDARAEKKMAMEDEIAPLDLTKTAASRGVRTHTGR
jgi:hypothetical protein